MVDIVSVKPGYRAAGVVQGGSDTGACSGVAAWNIGDSEKLLVVLWDIPARNDQEEDNKNTVAIGIMAEQDISSIFPVMRYEEVRNFIRKEFTEEEDEKVKFVGEEYLVTARIGTSNILLLIQLVLLRSVDLTYDLQIQRLIC